MINKGMYTKAQRSQSQRSQFEIPSTHSWPTVKDSNDISVGWNMTTLLSIFAKITIN